MLGNLKIQWDQVLVLICLALVLAPIDITLTKAVITKPLRDRLKTRSEMVHELFSCPYCMSHWLSFLAVGLFHVTPIDTGFWIFNFLSAIFVLITLTCLVVGVVFRAIDV